MKNSENIFESVFFDLKESVNDFIDLVKNIHENQNSMNERLKKLEEK